MGADLIVYILKGPRTISKARTARAALHARKIQRKAKLLHAHLAKKTFSIAEEQAADRVFASRDFDGFRTQSGLDRLSEAEEGLGEMASIELRKFFPHFLNWWRVGGARDTCSRRDPDDSKKQIVVCGDMSWGDSPDGEGYRLVDQAYWFDIPQNLGLY